MTNAELLTQIVLNGLTRLAVYNAKISAAQASGVDISDADLDAAIAEDDAAKAALDAAIAKARGV